jgi:nitrite reductase/ring-hydroxylating ferredoxin subunit
VPSDSSLYDKCQIITQSEEHRMQFVDACALEAVAPGEALAVHVGDRDIALFNVEGTLYALENSCLHAGSSLAAGAFCGRIVTCRAHGWRYDVTTGAVLVAPGLTVAKFPVKIADGRVLVATGTS